MSKYIPTFTYPFMEGSNLDYHMARWRVSGLSLFEILIVLLLVSLVFGFGLPLTTQWYHNQLATMMEKDIEQAVEQGIQESHILGEPLRLVPLRDKEWSTGLALLREADLTTTPPVVALYVWQWRNTANHVIWHGFLSNAYLRFTPELGQAALNGYFLIDSPNHPGRRILVNRIGRIRKISAE